MTIMQSKYLQDQQVSNSWEHAGSKLKIFASFSHEMIFYVHGAKKGLPLFWVVEENQ